jgi:hypothetical protein
MMVEAGTRKGKVFWLLDAYQMVDLPKIPILSSYMYQLSSLPMLSIYAASLRKK